ncbi:Mobile element protein [uncultured Microcoleus sp.]|uniref:Mobile element protein n=1 Tax=uncultured Microcoleus sp. TaxID=259945 RepID=A0A6J4LKA3_9CYAN|nr:Mobile element protein [uncultured Microcoleus sp.]
MWRTLGIDEIDWRHTPFAVQTKLRSQYHETHSLKLRSVFTQKQIASLTEPAAYIQRLNQRIASQEKQIIHLRQQLTETICQSAEIARLNAEIADLKEKLGRNSRNSSLPPSSDSPFGKPAASREPSGCGQGAQAGHTGAGHRLKPIDQVDRMIDLRPSACSFCGSLLLGTDESPARRQVIEITAAGTSLTEYRRHCLRCLSCRKINRAEWSEEARGGAFGAKVVAVIGYLTGRLGISHRDAVDAMRELFAVKISLGSISAAQKRLSQNLVEPVAALHEFVERQWASLVDETSWREKQTKPWLWVKATARATVFRILPGRSQQDARTMIGKNEMGVVTSDRYPGYNHLALQHRQICWAHIQRDFQAIAERAGDSTVTGEGLLKQSKQLFRLWRLVRDGTITKIEFQKLIVPIKEKVSDLLFAGTVSSHSKTRKTCSKIVKLELSLWTFSRVEGIEPTNNQAERALRRAVLWRRKSFGTQSESGSRFVERILTVVTTLRQQRRSVLDYLKMACAANAAGENMTGLNPPAY